MDQYPVPESPMRIQLDAEECFAVPKRFQSGSVGWYLSTKQELDGVRCQVSLSIVVIGSKPKATAVEATGKAGEETPKEPPKDLVEVVPENGQPKRRVKPPKPV